MGSRQMVATSFATEMVEMVKRRHCVGHPLTEAWVSGKLSREQLGRWGIEHYHYTKDLYFFIGRILSNCDVPEGRAIELENLAEEEDPHDMHNQQLLDFIAGCGIDAAEAVKT